MPISWNEIGDQRLGGGVADREEEATKTEHEQPGRGAAASRDEAQHDRGLPDPAGENQWPPADVVREVAAEVAGGDPDQRADEVGEAQQRLISAEPLDRPDPDEAEDGRGRQ